MKNKEFLEENLGRIYMYNGSFVEVVGYLDESPGVINIVRYLNPGKERGRAKGWGSHSDGDVVAQGYDKPGSVYSYVSPRYIKGVTYADAVKAFAEAYKGEEFDLNGEVVTVVGYSTGYGAVIVKRPRGGWQMSEGADYVLFSREQKTFNYVDYRKLKPL